MVRRARSGAVAAAIVLPSRPARTPADALADPEIRADSGLAEVLVGVGMLRREEARVRSVRLHGLRLELLPADGGARCPSRGRSRAGPGRRAPTASCRAPARLGADVARAATA